MHVVRGTCTLEQVHISNSHLHIVTGRTRADSALTLAQPELSDSHSGASFRAHALPRQVSSRLCHFSQTNLIWTIPITRRSLGTAEQLCFSRANCRCQNVYLWKPNTWCSWRKCGGTLHPSPTTWPTNTSAIASTARDPTLRTTWWTLTIYLDQQLYSDVQ